MSTVRLSKVLAVAAAASLIAMATLLPGREGASVRIPFLCIACGDFGIADVVANVVLFAPLGWTLALRGMRPRPALLIVVAVPLVIEGLQCQVIPGRYASLSDSLANSVGGAVGYALPRLHQLAFASHSRPGRVAIAYAVLLTAGIVTSMRVMAVPMPGALSWQEGRAFPQPGYGRFLGEVESVQINGAAAARGAWRVFLPGETLSLSVGIRSGPVQELRAEVVEVPTMGGGAWAWVDQEGLDLIVHVSSASDRLRLRGHTIRMAEVVPGVVGASIVIHVAASSYRYQVVVQTDNRESVLSVDLSPADGWRLFLPFGEASDRWAWLFRGLWMAVLAGPLGYFASSRSRSHALAAGICAIGYSLVVPLMLGCSRLGVDGWAGLVTGGLLGALAGANHRPGQR